jgi:hypothetical protein
MRLSDLFRPQVQKESASAVKISESAGSSQLNKQIRALVPGQTIQGEVAAKNGSEVQIKLAPDVIISARLSKDVNLEVGKPVVFQVKNNGSSLTLQPLFTNTAGDANVLKALEQAYLPVNDTTVAMGESMMKAGLSIDKQTLLQVFREISQFPEYSSDDVVDLHRLGLPVTEDNLSQVSSYKNATYQLASGLDQLAEEIPQTVRTLIDGGETQKGLALYKAYVSLQLEGGLTSIGTMGKEAGGIGAEALGLSGGGIGDVATGTGMTDSGTGDKALGTSGVGTGNETAGALGMSGVGTGNETAGALGVSGVGTGNETAGALGILGRNATNASVEGELGLSGIRAGNNEGNSNGGGNNTPTSSLEKIAADFYLELSAWENGNGDGKNLLANLNNLLSGINGRTSDEVQMLRSLLSDHRVNQLLKDAMQEQLAITPQAVSDKENVNRLYQHWHRQMQTLAETMEQNQLLGTGLSNKVDQLNQNLDFLNQVNQMMQYVQLPIKMAQNTAHGDLYVYTNKKNLAAAEGKLSALLHLDMEHLGPIDIYVSLEASKVNTHFYLADNSLLDFMMKHMDQLDQRLKEKGYDAKCEITVKETPGENPIQTILAQNNQRVSKPLLRQGFDVRA